MYPAFQNQALLIGDFNMITVISLRRQTKFEISTNRCHGRIALVQ